MRLALIVVLALAGSVVAQPSPPTGFARPTVSPYINLARGTGGINNAALNYYGIVRPEQAFRQQASQLQQQLSSTNQNLGNLVANSSQQQQQIAVTGRGATFVNYSHYFNNPSAGGGSMAGSSFNRSSGLGGLGGLGGGVAIGVGGGTAGRGISSGGGRSGVRR